MHSTTATERKSLHANTLRAMEARDRVLMERRDALGKTCRRKLDAAQECRATAAKGFGDLDPLRREVAAADAANRASLEAVADAEAHIIKLADQVNERAKDLVEAGYSKGLDLRALVEAVGVVAGGEPITPELAIQLADQFEQVLAGPIAAVLSCKATLEQVEHRQEIEGRRQARRAADAKAEIAARENALADLRQRLAEAEAVQAARVAELLAEAEALEAEAAVVDAERKRLIAERPLQRVVVLK